MKDIVLLHHDEPMTTSLAIAEGVEIAHKSVIQLIRKYLGEMQQFGEVTFQMRLNPQGSPTELTYLNEPQATLLLTFMRNSEIVVKFKVALVKAFFELRDQNHAGAIPTRNEPLTMSHRAGVSVSADRTFRAMMRTGRSAGLTTPQALRRAQAVTLEQTGVDMFSRLDIEPPEDIKPVAPNNYGMSEFLVEWRSGRLPVAYTACRSAEFYQAYARWCSDSDIKPAPRTRYGLILLRCAPDIEKRHLTIGSGVGRINLRMINPAGARLDVQPEERSVKYLKEIEQFSDDLHQWSRD
ncbi:MAG: Rha family transcriptional regulator [Gammaproteobacteria bacterium]|nr:Rha family transcriptional regulator [Gammaproteobacteria bacterium]